MSIWQASTTAASNATGISGVNWAEGMNPSEVNDSARAGWALHAEYLLDAHGAVTSGGNANAMTLTTNSGPPSLRDGLGFKFIAGNNANAGATLNVDGLGAKKLRAFGADIIAGDIVSGHVYGVSYDASADSGNGAWLVENPSASRTISSTVTVTGSWTFGAGTSSYSLLLDSAVNSVGTLGFRSAGVDRWQWRKTTGESTGNAGANLSLIGYSDAGAVLGTWLNVGRAAGDIDVPGVYNETTASSANVVVASNGSLQRSTSSRRYKTQIETLDAEHRDIVLSMRPVWYRSTSPSDNAEWSYYGLIAEEVADLDPRLVNWSALNDGSLQAEGVMYDRIVPHLIAKIQQGEEVIGELRARIEALEASEVLVELIGELRARIEALEGNPANPPPPPAELAIFERRLTSYGARLTKAEIKLSRLPS